ncbi:Rib/alpha-like domain-containing protein, partial [Dermabacter vaginalis]|uniref:Rib/alpha-like domain-containing protein n=1 Tax=Dermabacter vaginalis TaxID=1630135 RepID=UPI001EF6EED0
MVFDAFRKRNSHRAESSVTPLWRRGAAALAVGAVLGTTGVVGASAIDAPSAFAFAGDENIPDRDCDPKDAKPARWGDSSDMAVPTDTDACHFMGWVNVTNQEPTTLPNTGDPAPELKTAKAFNVYKPSDSRLKVTVNADESLTIDASDVPLDVVTDMGGKNPTAVYVVDLVGEDGTYYGRLGVYADLTPLPGDDAGSEEISAWEDSITVPSGQSVTYDAHEFPAGTVIDNEKYMKENLRVTRNSDGTLTIDATETPEGALGTMYFFHPDNPDQAFGMLTIEVQAPESEPKQSDDFDPKYTDTDLTQGDVSDAPTFDDPATDEVESAPEGTKFEKKDGPEGITVDEETGALVIGDDVPAGEHKVVVEVTYPDGSTDEVEVTVNISAKPTADDYNPQYTENEFTQGDISSAPTFDDPTTDDAESAPEGTKFAPKSEDNYGLPEGVTVDPETGALIIAEDAEPGSYPIAVDVTYPDGSKDTIHETIVIKAKPEADKYNPQYTENEFTQGDISSAPTFDDPTTDDAESAPEGTKFAP